MWARIGSLFILSKHLGNASQVGEGAGGCGHALAAFKYSLNTQKMQPGVGSGEGGGVVWAVGVVRARGGVGTHWQPFNTL